MISGVFYGNLITQFPTTDPRPHTGDECDSALAVGGFVDFGLAQTSTKVTVEVEFQVSR